MTKIGFNEFKYSKIIALIEAENVASIRASAACGFIYQYEDCYAFLREGEFVAANIYVLLNSAINI